MSFEVILPDKTLVLDNFTGNKTQLKSLLHTYTSTLYDYTFVNADNVWEVIEDQPLSLYKRLRVVPIEPPTEHEIYSTAAFPPLAELLKLPTEKLLHFLKQLPFQEHFIQEVGHVLKTFQPQRDELLVYNLASTQMKLLQETNPFEKETPDAELSTLNNVVSNLAIETITAVEDVYPSQSGVSQMLKKLMGMITQLCVYSVKR